MNESIAQGSVCGTLKKSHISSRIVKFHKDSLMAKTYLTGDPHRVYQGEIGSKKHIPITVIQVMPCWGGLLLVEYVDTENYCA